MPWSVGVRDPPRRPQASVVSLGLTFDPEAALSPKAKSQAVELGGAPISVGVLDDGFGRKRPFSGEFKPATWRVRPVRD